MPTPQPINNDNRPPPDAFKAGSMESDREDEARERIVGHHGGEGHASSLEDGIIDHGRGVVDGEGLTKQGSGTLDLHTSGSTLLPEGDSDSDAGGHGIWDKEHVLSLHDDHLPGEHHGVHAGDINHDAHEGLFADGNGDGVVDGADLL